MIEKTRLFLQWISDLLSGEMIEAPDYKKTYLGFDSVSFEELDFLVLTGNNILELMGENSFRIAWEAGEIVPVYP